MNETIEVIRFIDMKYDCIRSKQVNQKPLFYVHRFYDVPFHNSGRHIAANQVSLFNYVTGHTMGQRANEHKQQTGCVYGQSFVAGRTKKRDTPYTTCSIQCRKYTSIQQHLVFCIPHTGHTNQTVCQLGSPSASPLYTRKFDCSTYYL